MNKQETFSVIGMKCEHCISKVEQALRNLEGVAEAHADLAAHNVAVAYDPSLVSPDAMQEAVEDCGFQLVVG